MISGQQVDFQDIYTEGITNISVEDMKYAKELGMTIKLLATSKSHEDKISAIVAPFMLENTHPLYSVNGVFNAIYVNGNVLGPAMFYGSGAGKLPTASAVVSDVVDIAKHLDKNIMTMWESDKLTLENKSKLTSKYFVRISGTPEELESHLTAVFGEIKIVTLDDVADEFGFVTDVMAEGRYDEKAEHFPAIKGMIRIA